MGRYVVFAYDLYDARGGWDDLFHGPTDDFAQATRAAKMAVVKLASPGRFDYAQIVDLETLSCTEIEFKDVSENERLLIRHNADYLAQG